MKRWIKRVMLSAFGMTMVACAAAAEIDTPEGRSLERERIAAERSSIEATLDAKDRECQTRFVVTSCRNQVRLERIRSLDELKRQEGILNKLDRQAAAAKQLQKLDEKTR
ncbi:MAG: hypothetical protein QM533_10505 [Cytophagales bacterium]|nr:hypothetical protein [Cytophagales bacterium]